MSKQLKTIKPTLVNEEKPLKNVKDMNNTNIDSDTEKLENGGSGAEQIKKNENVNQKKSIQNYTDTTDTENDDDDSEQYDDDSDETTISEDVANNPDSILIDNDNYEDDEDCDTDDTYKYDQTFMIDSENEETETEYTSSDTDTLIDDNDIDI